MDFTSKAAILILFLLAVSESTYGKTYYVVYPNITRNCLRCMCEVASDCNLNVGCDGSVCGPYRLTKSFWMDGHKPTVNNEPNTADGAFERCANDRACAESAIQIYVRRFRQSCSGPDSRISCDDFFRIYRYGGGGGCKHQRDPYAENKYQECKKKLFGLGFAEFVTLGIAD